MTALTSSPAIPPTQPAAPPTPPALPQFVKKSIHPDIIAQCRQLFFRQSMVKDYLGCPQMAFYRWVLNFDQSPPFFSTIMGSAGHYAIYTIHESRKYDYDYIGMLRLLEDGFRRELAKIPLYPDLPVNTTSPEEAFGIKAPEYVKLLLGYQAHPRNKEFHSTSHEQAFVLSIPSADLSLPPYLLTGQIDQMGYYDDGRFSIRDPKFREKQFRPGKAQLDLDIQATTYCTALKYGQPVCERCRPHYDVDPIAQQQTLIYHGPCADCLAKIGTPAWPQRYADMFEMIWMHDFNTYDKDEHEMWIIDRSNGKIPNPKGKGPAMFPRKPNPDYDAGYKKGDFKGPGFLPTIRPPSSLGILMSDVLRICDEFRSGAFYRLPGETCNFMCKFREQCLKGLEFEIQEANLANINNISTDDPW